MSSLIKHPPLPTTPKQRRYWTPPHGSARALLIAEAARTHDGLLVAVARDTQRAQALEAELKIFAGGLPVLHFPDWETLPYDVFSPHPEIVSQRIATLYRLPGVKRGVLVVPVATLMQRIAPRAHITGSGLVLAQAAETRPRQPSSAGSKPPATATCRRWPSRATSPCAARCSTSSRWAAPSRTASSCSTTRWNRSAASIRKPSARSSRWTRSNCCPRASFR